MAGTSLHDGKHGRSTQTPAHKEKHWPAVEDSGGTGGDSRTTFGPLLSWSLAHSQLVTMIIKTNLSADVHWNAMTSYDVLPCPASSGYD